MPLQSFEEKEKGVGLKYKTFDEDEYIIIHSVLTDECIDDCREKAQKTGKFKSDVFTFELITAMVMNYRILNPDGTEWKLTKDSLSKAPSSFRQWLSAELDKCDGSLAKGAIKTVAGVEVTFREAA